MYSNVLYEYQRVNVKRVGNPTLFLLLKFLDCDKIKLRSEIWVI